jgi:hypothetical protein
MPQMDDKVNVYFGRISSAVWDRISDQPGAIVDRAVAALAEAIDAGQTFHYPSSLKVGIRKMLWVRPETKATLLRLSKKTGQYNTPLILTALDLYLPSLHGESSPSAPVPYLLSPRS